jgi:hypothetical protein
MAATARMSASGARFGAIVYHEATENHEGHEVFQLEDFRVLRALRDFAMSR